MKKTLLLIVTIFLGLSVNSYAQQDDDLEIFDKDLWDESEIDVNFFSDIPMIEIIYGLETPSIHKDIFNSSFNKPSSLEGRFGYIDINKNLYNSSVFSVDGHYVFIGYITNELSFNKNDVDDRKFSIDLWNFGITDYEGYGWEFSPMTNMQFYNNASIMWSGVNSDDSLINREDFRKIERISDGVRFGDSYETGIKFQIYKPVNLAFGYTRQLIYTRLLFWKWAGSKIIQAIGDELVNMFNDDILEASPSFGPVIYFILNTAYNYGWYELSKSRMNFPFSTEKPLIIDGLKFGFNLTF